MERNKMTTVSPWNWNRVADSIFYNDNHYVKYASYVTGTVQPNISCLKNDCPWDSMKCIAWYLDDLLDYGI